MTYWQDSPLPVSVPGMVVGDVQRMELELAAAPVPAEFVAADDPVELVVDPEVPPTVEPALFPYDEP